MAPQSSDVTLVVENLSVAPPHQSSPLIEGKYRLHAHTLCVAYIHVCALVLHSSVHIIVQGSI